MKKIITLVFAVLVSVTCLAFTTSVSAADDGVMFSFSYPAKTNGVVDGKQTVKLSKPVVDGENTLKLVPSKESALVKEIRLDCYTLNYPAKELDGAKYVTVKYRYDGDASLTSPMLFMMLSGGGALDKNLTFTATEPTKSGEWALALFDISAIEGNLNFEEGKVFKQIHIMPYGGWDIKVDDLSAKDVMYISDITFYNKMPDLASVKLPKIVDKFTYEQEMAEQEDALTERPPLEGDENGLLFSFSYPAKNNGIVEGKKTAVLSKVKEDDIYALKVVPSPDTALTNFISLDCYSVKYRKSEIFNANFLVIKYKYIAPEDRKHPEKMTVALLQSGGALNGIQRFESMNTIKNGVWDLAIFDISGKKLSSTAGGYFQQFHFMPYGEGMNVADLKPDQEMFISDVSFYTTNPDPEFQYTLSFRKGAHPDIVGDGNSDIKIKYGEKTILPEPGYTADKAGFKGWKSSVDNLFYGAGEEYFHTVPKDVTFTAEFTEETSLSGNKVLKFVDYQNGSVDRRDNITVSKTIFQNKEVVKIVPNPKGAKADANIMIDGYSYLKGEIDLSEYRYLVVTYYIDGDLPDGTIMTVSVLPSGGVLTKGVADDSEPLSENRWDYALFDLTGMKEVLNPDAESHLLRQMHIIPMGWRTFSKDLTGNETMYIADLMFCKEQPPLTTHEAYMKGYDGGLFKPQGNMTRAEACTIVARLSAGNDTLVPSDKTTAFTDVPSDQWYHKYISYVESLGYLKSYSGAFLPDKAITRAEFVELVYNMGLLKDAGKNGTFTDVSADHPKAAVIAAAGKAGLVNGYDNGDGTFSFKPDNTITRAEVVKVVNNAYGRSITVDQLAPEVKYSFNDVEKTFWAYADIMEATLPHVKGENGWSFCMVNPISIAAKTNADIDFEAGKSYLEELDKISAEKIEAIRNTPNIDDSKISGTKYYVSNNGDDKNDGKSPEKAWKTIAKVEVEQRSMKQGDAILFERGGVWREPMNKARTGVIYSAYGEGPKPRLYGSPENGADASKWTLMEGTNNIWVYATEMIDVGAIICDEGKVVGLKEVPDLIDGKFFVRSSNGTKEFDVKTELDQNHEFFSDIPSTAFKTQKGKIYFRCDEGNPGSIFKQIEFNIDVSIIRNDDAKNVVYDNLCFMYTGIHGISSGSTSNITVQNCEIAWIGGALQNYTNGKAVRLGNGVEVYGSVDGFVVDNCYVYQCYDAGVTQQHAKGGTNNISMYNITYSNNIIEDCVYNIEYFTGEGANTDVIRDGRNFFITGNILRRAGYGWGNQRPDNNINAHIKSWDHRNEYEKGTYIIENNIFDRASCNLVETIAKYDSWCPIYKNNTYLQVLDERLAYHKNLDVKFDCNAEQVIRYDIGDESAKVYFLPESYKYQGFLIR
ncbi:MAG: hypothetical protein E7583_04775 [Ruminococcaceae bacterium]|nr:hypothetical protein [Oscillospiraceae bacterium]